LNVSSEAVNANFFGEPRSVDYEAGALTTSQRACVCACSTRLLSRDGSLLFQNRKQKRHP